MNQKPTVTAAMAALYHNPYDRVKAVDGAPIRLHRFGLADEQLKRRVPALSPFSTKLEAYLRFAGYPYDVVLEAGLDQAPRGKVPFVEIGEVALADSALIIAFLEKHRAPRGLDAGLDATQRMQGTMLRRTLEDHLYWVTLYHEFVDPNGSAFLVDAVFGGASDLAVAYQADYADRLWQQGLGRYSKEEILDQARADFDAIATLLGDAEYILRTTAPTSYDAAVFGLTLMFFQVPELHPELTAYVRSKSNLCDYTRRVLLRYFPELSPSF